MKRPIIFVFLFLLPLISLISLIRERFKGGPDESECQLHIDQAVMRVKSTIVSNVKPPPSPKPPPSDPKPDPDHPPGPRPGPSKPESTANKDNSNIQSYQEQGPVTYETIQATAPHVTGKFPFSTYSPARDPAVSKHVIDSGTPYCSPQLVEMIYTCVEKKKASGEKCVFADVGANIGSCSVVAGLLGAKVYAFEALKDNAYLTFLNIFQNKLTETVKVFPFGVSNERKQIEIFRLIGNLGHNMVSVLECPCNSLFIDRLSV